MSLPYGQPSRSFCGRQATDFPLRCGEPMARFALVCSRASGENRGDKGWKIYTSPWSTTKPLSSSHFIPLSLKATIMASISTAGEAGKLIRIGRLGMHGYPSNYYSWPLLSGGCANSSSFFSVTRIAYLSSDVIISVQPSLATDSEFSGFLRSYSNNKAPSLVAKELPEVLWSSLSTISNRVWPFADSSCPTQCRPSSLRISAHSLRKNCLRHHYFHNPRQINTPPL